MAIAFHEVLEDIKHYDHDAKLMIKEYCEQLLQEEGRAQIVANVESGMKQLKDGNLKSYTNIQDLKADLDAD